jgi:hypothetical protein
MFTPLSFPLPMLLDKSKVHWAFQLIFFLFMLWDFGYYGQYWPIVPAVDDRWWWLWRNWWNKDWQGKPKYSEKTWPSSTLSTTNPTWLDPVLHSGHRGGKPATNSLSYDAVIMSTKVTKLMTQISEVIGWNFGRDTDYSNSFFSRFLDVNFGIVFQIRI